jgi:hypothetical protein
MMHVFENHCLYYSLMLGTYAGCPKPADILDKHSVKVLMGTK